MQRKKTYQAPILDFFEKIKEEIKININSSQESSIDSGMSVNLTESCYFSDDINNTLEEAYASSNNGIKHGLFILNKVPNEEDCNNQKHKNLSIILEKPCEYDVSINSLLRETRQSIKDRLGSNLPNAIHASHVHKMSYPFSKNLQPIKDVNITKKNKQHDINLVKATGRNPNR